MSGGQLCYIIFGYTILYLILLHIILYYFILRLKEIMDVPESQPARFLCREPETIAMSVCSRSRSIHSIRGARTSKSR